MTAEPTLSAAEELLETYHRRSSTLLRIYWEMTGVELTLSQALSRHQAQMEKARERLLSLGFSAEDVDHPYPDVFGGVSI